MSSFVVYYTTVLGVLKMMDDLVFWCELSFDLGLHYAYNILINIWLNSWNIESLQYSPLMSSLPRF
jgi:hypothetical protein